MSLSQIIRTRREQMGLTQDQVSAQAGISKPYLSNIETDRAKNPPTDGVLVNLERALKFDPGQLVRLAHLARTPLDVREDNERLQAEISKLRGVIKQLLADGTRSIGDAIDHAAATGPDSANSRPAGTEPDGPDHADQQRPDAPHPNITHIPAGVLVPIINRVAAGYPHQFTDLDYPPSVADEYIRVPDMHDAQAFGARVVGDSMEPAYQEGDVVIFSPNTPARSGDDCFVRFEADQGTTFKRVYQDDAEHLRLQPLNESYPPATYHREEVSGLWPAVYRVQRLR
jgi:SOS-response transcriptional repressor LexA